MSDLKSRNKKRRGNKANNNDDDDDDFEQARLQVNDKKTKVSEMKERFTSLLLL